MSKAGGIMFSDFRLYYSAKVVNGTGRKTDT